MRKPMIAANWKMNKTIKQALEFINQFKPLVKDVNNTEILICPSYVALSDVKKSVEGSNIKLGAQDIYYEDKGAYTSKISAEMLKDIVEYVIIGHSETRQYFNETNKSVNKKVKKAIENGLKVILCIGETLEQREQGETNEIVKEQLIKGLEGVNQEVVVAYEPVWAIGTGKAANPEIAEQVHKMIREIVGENVSILYGGSVKPENVESYMNKENIDGALVGGAALDVEKFACMINKI